jgi:hypothetical protein
MTILKRRRVMKRMSIAVLLVFVVEVSVGCNKAKDEVLTDGTKLFGVHTPWGGIKTAERREWTNGQNDFDLSWLKDGTIKIGRTESPEAKGEKHFDMAVLPDGTQIAERLNTQNGEKQFDVASLNGTIARFCSVPVLEFTTEKRGL